MSTMHTTLSGHLIEYTPTPEVAAFLDRMRAMLEDPRVTENEMIAAAYGRENPMLEPYPIGDRGMVTRATLENPAYHVLADLLVRKRVAQDGTDVAAIAAQHTVSVTEAAHQLGIHESAVRQAIAARRLSSWLKDGKHWLRPEAVASFQVGTRGPKPAESREVGGPLQIRLGNAPGASFRVRYPGALEQEQRVGAHTITGTLPAWRRVAVLAGGEGDQTLYVLEPGGEENEVAHKGFSVRGRFRVAEKITEGHDARAAWKAFRAS
jgi:hypothetical protein